MFVLSVICIVIIPMFTYVWYLRERYIALVHREQAAINHVIHQQQKNTLAARAAYIRRWKACNPLPGPGYTTRRRQRQAIEVARMQAPIYAASLPDTGPAI